MLPSLVILYFHFRGKKNGKPYFLPWISNSGQGIKYQVLGFLILGAILEFVGCQFLMLSWNLGQQANLNDGITSALILFASPMILILSYCIYKEKINSI
jgi:hypothetical protein